MYGRRGYGHLAMLSAIGLLAAVPAAPIHAIEERPQPDQPRQTRPRGTVRLNRSRKWDHADTYAEARAQSPHRPVR